MSLFSSSSTSRSNGGTSPSAPADVHNGIVDFTRLINQLGRRNPNDYVSGPSYLQNAAFSLGSRIASRYGANVTGGPGSGSMGFGTPVGVGGGAYQWGNAGVGPIPGGSGSGGGGSLHDRAGIQSESAIDFDQYVANDPDLLAGFNNLSAQDRMNISRAIGDGSGYVSREMFGRIHYDTFGSAGRQLVYHGQEANPGQPTQPVTPGDTQGWAQPGYGYTPANDDGFNPVSGYQDAFNLTRNVGGSGANTAGLAHLGSANGYSPSTITDDMRVDMGSAAQGAAQRGIKFSKDYENEYVDDVINPVLERMDREQGMERAALMAHAAKNNAFGGSRFGLERQEQAYLQDLAKRSKEAEIRFGAQDRAFGFGMADADRYTNASIANAQMRNQHTQAQAGMDFSRLLANMDASNRASEFNANADNAFDLTRFGAANDMARFNAGQEDSADARDLAAAGQLADISGAAAHNERQDLAMIAGLGDREREIDQQARTADLRLMELMAQLYGMTPLDVVTGQRTHGETSGTHNPSAISNIKDILDIGSSVAAIFG